MLKRSTNIKLVTIGFLIVFSLFSGEAKATGANFYIVPTKGEFMVGKNISAVARLNSNGNAINAAEGIVDFSEDTLEVVSISKTGSIFSLWPVEPTFDNKKGLISFAGGSPTAYSGSSGQIISIVFVPKTASNGKMEFTTGRILLADGSGTDIFIEAIGALWNFIKPKEVPAKEPVPVPALPKPTTTTSQELSPPITEVGVEKKIEAPPISPNIVEERIRVLGVEIAQLKKILVVLFIANVVIIIWGYFIWRFRRPRA